MSMFSTIRADLEHHLFGTFYAHPFKVTALIVLKAMLTPEFRVVLGYRLNNWLWYKGFKIIAFLRYQRHKRKYNCDISPMAIIGKGLRVVHASDIVIGPSAKIGVDCVFFNGITLGNRKRADSIGDGMPELGKEVLVGTGAKLLGPIKIGDKVRIGANAVVLSSFDHGTIAGAPAVRKEPKPFRD